jgi:CRP-like cAMP-binding protein
VGTGEYARSRTAVKNFVIDAYGETPDGRSIAEKGLKLAQALKCYPPDRLKPAPSLYSPRFLFAMFAQNLHRDLIPTANTITMGVQKNQLLARLPMTERERLMPYLEPVNLHFGQILVEFDNPIEYVYFLETAVTSTVVRSPHGETLEVGIMGSEGFVGLSLIYGVSHSNGTVLVQIPGRAMCMKAADFNRHIRSHGGPCLEMLLRYANFFQVMVQQHAACNATHTVEERMCRWILLTHDRAGSDSFALTHEYLSLMLGTRRATVTSIAHKLKEAGVISYTRGKLRVTDRPALEDGSCECYRLIKDQTRRTLS